MIQYWVYAPKSLQTAVGFFIWWKDNGGSLRDCVPRVQGNETKQSVRKASRYTALDINHRALSPALRVHLKVSLQVQVVVVLIWTGYYTAVKEIY